MKIILPDLEKHGHKFPEGFTEKLLRTGTMEGNILVIDDLIYREIHQEYFCNFPQPWPIVLRPLKILAKPGDRGAGDIIARIIGPIGGEAFKVWYKRLFGTDCGCGHRQEVLNQRWPM